MSCNFVVSYPLEEGGAGRKLIPNVCLCRGDGRESREGIRRTSSSGNFSFISFFLLFHFFASLLGHRFFFFFFPTLYLSYFPVFFLLMCYLTVLSNAALPKSVRTP
jgi:cellulose synthase/poly-beta-1,6-N-acetylglucosamine synthase-like glycosyltransferase